MELVKYITYRKIPLNTAKNYCQEVWYQNNDKTFFALGLRNNDGGWELRNKYYKTSTSPKTFSYIDNGHKNVLVTEGMFDLFSLDSMLQEKIKEVDLLVLNSVAFVKKMIPILTDYEKILLYLDNDLPGDLATNYLLDECPQSHDCRELYKGYKDANEKLMSWI